MKCTNCGFEFDEGIFCPHCGTKSLTVNNINEETFVPDNSSIKTSKRKVFPIILGVVVVFVVIAVVISFISNKESEMADNYIEDASPDEYVDYGIENEQEDTETTNDNDHPYLEEFIEYLKKTDPNISLSDEEYITEYEYWANGEAYTDLYIDDNGQMKNKYDKDYILPNSSDVVLTESDLDGLSAQELTYARNEIYARHGYIFNSAELNDYFLNTSWYWQDESFSGALEGIEQQNANFISDYQKRYHLEYKPN